MNELTNTYRNTALSEKFVPENYFTGSIEATGVFVDRFGVIRRRFNVSIIGSKKDNGFSLDEYFLFDDGEQEIRKWEIEKIDHETYVGKCEDVCGEAIGKLCNSILNWQYHFNLKMFNHKIKVKFEDIMVQQTPSIMLNNAKIKKCGLLLGQVFISFNKNPQPSSLTKPLYAAK